eukprot:3394633-Rhodomonas_salina.1
MIELTKKKVEKRYTIDNGFAHNADVVYGDTDSGRTHTHRARRTQTETLCEQRASLLQSACARVLDVVRWI